MSPATPGSDRPGPHGPAVHPADRERAIVEAFVTMADTLVAGFDVIDYLDGLTRRCVHLLAVQAAGVLLADRSGHPQVAATSSHQAELLEVFEIQSETGPCLECLRTGDVIIDSDGDTGDDASLDTGDGPEPAPTRQTAPTGPTMPTRNDWRWPAFTQLRREQGFVSVYAVPMRLRREVIGALNLFRAGADPLPASDLELARGLADMAAIGLLQERAIHSHALVAEQLQAALNSRVMIEQAKGVLAERHSLDMDQAFEALRRFARTNRLSLVKVAEQILTATPTGSHTGTVTEG